MCTNVTFYMPNCNISMYTCVSITYCTPKFLWHSQICELLSLKCIVYLNYATTK